jgi:pimeloyl-ACP methyl ester carboxylesterase
LLSAGGRGFHERVTVVFVHGLPETRDIWRPLRAAIGRPSVAVALPGFGTPRPVGWRGTKDAVAAWLERELLGTAGPLDVVAHDLGALVLMRIVTATDVRIRSWVVDVPELFHPQSRWPESVQQLQKPGVGEGMIQASLGLPESDPKSIVARLRGAG